MSKKTTQRYIFIDWDMENPKLVSEEDWETLMQMQDKIMAASPVEEALAVESQEGETQLFEKDILLVMKQTNCLREVAITKLRGNNYDIVNSIYTLLFPDSDSEDKQTKERTEILTDITDNYVRPPVKILLR